MAALAARAHSSSSWAGAKQVIKSRIGARLGRVIRVIRVIRVTRVITVIRVIIVIRVIRVIRVNRVIRVIRVIRVVRVIRVIWVIRVIKVNRVIRPRVIKVIWVIRVIRVHSGYIVVVLLGLDRGGAHGLAHSERERLGNLGLRWLATGREKCCPRN